MKRWFVSTTGVLLLSCTMVHAQVISSDVHDFRVVTVASDLNTPWGMAFLPDGRILVTEKGGSLRIVTADGLDSTPVTGLPPVDAVGQGGLMDIALHPDYANNGWLYVSHVVGDDSGYSTELSRGRLDGYQLVDVERLFQAAPKSGGGRHFGSRLLFDNEGFLYITLGDRGHRPNGQDLSTHNGGVVRLHDDGSVPADNPFVGRDDALPEIYTSGNRNIQGATYDATHDRIWTHEHGPRGGDELNLIQAGTNYGWPTITHGIAYSGLSIGEGNEQPGLEQPVHYWVPSIAPSGMAYYDGERFPNWQGDLFVGALKFQLLVRLDMEGEQVVAEERLLKNQLGRIRDVAQGPDGYLYLLTDSPNGVLVRLEPVE